jgi:peptidoglycan/LPS O-acetylase OafA/YrhL
VESGFLISFQKKTTKKNTIAVLDGVRGLACLSVLAFHIHLMTLELHLWSFSTVGTLASAIMMTGSAGVTLFFVLSGFLLFLPYAKALLFEENPWPGTGQFYLRRVLRIFPGYYISLFLITLWTQSQYLQPAHWKEFGLFLTFLMDSTPLTYQKINGPYWTLAIEWQFYMLLPFLALGLNWIARRYARERRVWIVPLCLLGLMAWGVSSRYWGGYLMAHPSVTFLIPRPVLNVTLFFLYGTGGKYLEDFAVGMLISFCYVLSRQASPLHTLTQHIRRYTWWLWGTGLVWLLVVSLWHLNRWFPNTVPLFNPVSTSYDWFSELSLSLGFGLCITAILFGPAELKRLFEWRPLRWLGSISYSLYIWHLPILIFFFYSLHIRDIIRNWNPLLAYSIYWLCAVFVIIPFSYVLYRVVELPGMRVGDKLRKKQVRKEVSEHEQAGRKVA